jgi:hypothetical protein
MDGTAPISGVGAVTGQTALFQAQRQAVILRKQLEVSAAVGTNALRLIQSALVLPQGQGEGLDIQA